MKDTMIRVTVCSFQRTKHSKREAGVVIYGTKTYSCVDLAGRRVNKERLLEFKEETGKGCFHTKPHMQV